MHVMLLDHIKILLDLHFDRLSKKLISYAKELRAFGIYIYTTSTTRKSLENPSLIL